MTGRGGKYTRHDYTVGWLCALPESELVAAKLMLDHRHPPIRLARNDENIYTYGDINGHNIVITCLPPGLRGTTSAQKLVQPLRESFPKMRLHLFVGIGGGIPINSPSEKSTQDIHLGDVVVGWSEETGAPAVVQWDYGRYQSDGTFESLGSLDKPNRQLGAAVGVMQSNRKTTESPFHGQLVKLKDQPQYEYPGPDEDKLYQTDEPTQLLERKPRDTHDPMFHLGTILSGNSVMKDAKRRDELSKAFHNAICFEMEAAGVMDETHCLVIRGISDYADHYKNDLWQDYAAGTAAAFARQLLFTIQPSCVANKDVVLNLLTEEEMKCHQVFRTSDYETHKNRNPSRTAGTCIWFLQHPVYRAWRDEEFVNLLWVTADPGCGKSVLSKYLIDSRLEDHGSMSLCYFFFKDDNEDQRSAGNALNSLLHQIFTLKPALLQHAVAEYRSNAAALPTLFEPLWRIFERCAVDAEADDIVCLLDALDECHESTRATLIGKLDSFYNHQDSDAKPKPTMKFIVTSRPYQKIECAFEAYTIRLAGEKESESISQEISVVIKAKVPELATRLRIGDSDHWFVQDLEHHLLAIPHRTYLWLHLTMELILHRQGPLAGGLTRSRLKRVIEELPQSVSDAYSRILNKSTDKDRTRRLLHIIIAARRPLTLEEMNIAMGVEGDMASEKELDLESSEGFGKTVRNLCGFFVNIIKKKIYLIHQTAKEFLQRKSAGESGGAYGFWEHAFDPRRSHWVLRDICMSYLLLREIKSETMALERTDLYRFTKKYLFFEYSAKNWVDHFNDADNHDAAAVEAALSLLRLRKGLPTAWMLFCGVIQYIYRWGPIHNCSHNYTQLLIASSLGLFDVVKKLLDESSPSLPAYVGERSPLYSAVNGNHEAVVRLLLDYGFDPNIKEDEDTPLHRAAKSCNLTLVSLLVMNGADVEATDYPGNTPLHYAVYGTFEAVTRVLLDHGADPNAVDCYRGTPLHDAAKCGRTGSARLLLEKGASTTAVDIEGCTPLYFAVLRREMDVAGLLLQHGANPFAKDIRGRTPWDEAQSFGEEDMIKLMHPYVTAHLSSPMHDSEGHGSDLTENGQPTRKTRLARRSTSKTASVSEQPKATTSNYRGLKSFLPFLQRITTLSGHT